MGGLCGGVEAPHWQSLNRLPYWIRLILPSPLCSKEHISFTMEQESAVESYTTGLQGNKNFMFCYIWTVQITLLDCHSTSIIIYLWKCPHGLMPTHAASTVPVIFVTTHHSCHCYTHRLPSVSNCPLTILTATASDFQQVHIQAAESYNSTFSGKASTYHQEATRKRRIKASWVGIHKFLKK